MTAARRMVRRALAVDPTHRGFGFGVLESGVLLDWGLRQVTGDKKAGVIQKVASLIHRYVPHAVVVEDTGHRKCRRRTQGRSIIKAIVSLARSMEVPVLRVPMNTVKHHYLELGATNKDAIARMIADRFPEMRSVLPPPRRPWDSQDERLAVFDAISMVLTATENER